MSARLRFKSDWEQVDGEVTTLPGYGGSYMLPKPGDHIELFDEDGNHCIGLVARVDDSALIHVRPLWATWHEANSWTLTAPAAGPQETE